MLVAVHVNAYKIGAKNSVHNVRDINVAQLKFPILHTKDEFENGISPADIKTAQDKIRWL